MEPTSNTSLIDGNALTARLREEAARRLQASQETINGYAQTARQFGVSPTIVDTIIEKISGFFSWLGRALGITSAATTETSPPASAAPPAENAPPAPAPVVAPPAVTPPGAPASTNRTRGEGR